MIRRAFIIIGVSIVLTALYCVSGVAATVIVDSNNYITEIRSLVVEPYGIFNVEFYYGSYAEIWGTGFDFPGDYTAVEAACGALNGHDTKPQSIFFEGVGENSDQIVGEFYIPYMNRPEFPETQVRLRKGAYELYSGNYVWRNVGIFDTLKTDATPYAKFSQAPIPAAIWLLSSGLVGIAGIRRKFKQ